MPTYRQTKGTDSTTKQRITDNSLAPQKLITFHIGRERRHTMPETKETQETQKPKVTLIGQNGNAFVVMGLCAKAWRRAGNDPDEWEKIQTDMMSGDYDHLLCVAMDNFDVS